MATHNLSSSSSSSLQVWWTKVQEFESLHVPEMVELCLKIGPHFFLDQFSSSSPILNLKKKFKSDD
jgi:hypothetical protein